MALCCRGFVPTSKAQRCAAAYIAVRTHGTQIIFFFMKTVTFGCVVRLMGKKSTKIYYIK